MKKLLLVYLILVSIITVNAQDKIITINRDTIKCRIISVNADRISFEQKSSDKSVIGKSIPVTDVIQYFRNVKSENSEKVKVRDTTKKQQPERCWLFSVQGGLALSWIDYSEFKYLMQSMGVVSSEVNRFTKKIENGYHLGANFHFLLTTHFGIGADYNIFYSQSSGNFLVREIGTMNIPLFTNIDLKERLYIQFAGPSLMLRQYPDKNKRIQISESLSSGIVQFRDEVRGSDYQIYWGNNTSYSGNAPSYYDSANNVSKGSTLGVKGGLSVEYAFLPQFTAGVSGSFVWAKLNKMSFKNKATDTKNQKLNDAMDISHINYGISVRYNF